MIVGGHGSEPGSWLRVPVGVGSETWSTVGRSRTLLAIAHSVTALTRLMDVLTVLDNDLRVQVLFTPIPASAFDDGVLDFLKKAGARIVPWDQARHTRFDLAISASHSGDLHEISAPVILLPHGMGYNKYRRTEGGKGRAGVYGLAAEQLLHEGHLVPAAIVLSHEEQLRRLKLSCPPAVPAARVAGDLCLDRMSVSLPWRSGFRRALGVRSGERLVVVSSTWGRHSLLGRHPELPARLLAELPADEYRVALVAHPNVWYGHGPWQMRAWLADARRAGLMVIPPHEGWRAAVVAAECVIGDQGSVSLYSAALGRTTILATYADEEIDPETAMAALARVAPRLDHDAPLPGQIDAAIGAHDPASGERLAELAVAEPGQAARLLRSLIYELIDLPEPTVPARAFPVPPAAPETPDWGHSHPSLLVTTQVHGQPRHPVVRVARFPVILSDLRALPLSAPHLAVNDTETDPRLRELAEVLIRRQSSPGATAELAPEEVFALYPACRLVADVHHDDERCEIHLRDGHAPTTLRLPSGVDPALFASACLAVSTPSLPRRVTIEAGTRRLTARVDGPDS